MPGPVIVATIMRPQGDTGVQTHVRTFSEVLHGRGRRVETVTPYDAPMALVAPVFAVRRFIDPLSGPASVWWYRNGHAFFLRWALRRRLRSAGPCVVYAQCPLSADAALRSRSGPQQRVVMVVHFNVSQADEWAGKGKLAPDGSLARAIRSFEAAVLPRLDGLVFVSAYMREQLMARIPSLAIVPAAVVPNFVLEPDSATPAAMQAELLMIGTLEPRKNQAYALQIIAAAQRDGVGPRLTIVGDGPDRAVLEALARELGIASKVHFAGRVQNAATWFPRHSACLHVATLENLPLTLVEALAYGVPMFAAPVGGVPEVFDDGREGRYLPLEDASKAAALITAWLADSETMQRAGHLARQRFLAHFEAGEVTTRLLHFIDSLTGLSHSR